MEQKRQECIYELIYTEEDFAKDMQYIKEVYQDLVDYLYSIAYQLYILVLDQTFTDQ